MRLKPLTVCVALLLLLAGCADRDASAPANLRLGFDGLVIAIDPGHGGIDHGAISSSGIKEDRLNLQVSLLVRDRLKNAGAIMVMTRQSAEVDYSGDSNTRKKRDMENRARLIVASNPDAVISIHMNKYPNKRYYGPQTFFLKESAEGKRLAEDVQSHLLGSLPRYKKFRIVEGDYFMLHVVNAPSILVECGFLSNTDDEKRLQDSNYQNTIAECIYRGICDYFGVQYNEPI
jgi:N-acetylmuramoyl-L-alanine amidase